MEEISSEEIRALDKVWHRLFLEFQRTSEELWKDKLKGVSTIEVSILSIIEKNPDVILKEIIEILRIPGSTLTSAVDRLEKRGLIRRTISQRDRRSFSLELTEAGREAQIEHRKSEEFLWLKILSSYDTNSERRQLIELLSKLVDNLERRTKK